MEIQVISRDLFFENVPVYLTPWFPSDKPLWFILDDISQAINEIYKANRNQYKKIKKNVYVGRDTEIDKYVEIKGPALIGKGCKIRHGAFLRENVIIGNNCVIGNSTELKNSVLFNNVEVPHFNYIGDSILGNYAHLGAGAKISNVLLMKNKNSKLDKKNDIILKEICYKNIYGKFEPTGRKKFGAVIGDYAEIGVNTTINPGTLLEMNMFVPSSISIGGYFRTGYTFPRNIIYESDSQKVPGNG
jgi:NDP-sugar pyrophosphorylase family protein